MKRRCVALLLSTIFLLPSCGATDTTIGRWSEDVNLQWWKEHSTPEQWVAGIKPLHKKMMTTFEKVGTKKALENRHFGSWAYHLFWLSIFPENWEQDDYFKTAEAQSTFRKIALDQKSQLLFLQNLSPHDDSLKALKIFCQIYQAHPKEMKEYANLAVAFSIVFDQPFPEGWPHAFVNKKSIPFGKSSPAERFAFYVKSSKEKKLLLDIRKMKPQDLKFVVDTPIKLSELEILQNVTIKTARQLEQLFQIVRYDKPRLKSGNYIWAHGSYLVRTINKKGGLCVDQAYFTVHTGKAFGIPSIMFMGQGNSGAHAWVGAMKSQGTWGFDYAKFRSEDYPVGQSYDPQTWKRLTDSECIFLDRRNETSDKRTRLYLIWALLNKDSPIYLETLRAARQMNPQFITTWEMESVAIAKEGEKDRERFWKDWIRTFTQQDDLQFRGQKRLLSFYQTTNKEREYDMLISSVMKSNKSKREDLVVKVIAEKIFVLIEQKKWEEADKAFLKSLQYLRSKAGGALFYNLVQPYVRICLDEGKTDFSKAAMAKSIKVFEAKKGSILDHDMKQLSRLVGRK